MFDRVVDDVMVCDEQIAHLETVLSKERGRLKDYVETGSLKSIKGWISTVRFYPECCMQQLGVFQKMEGYH